MTELSGLRDMEDLPVSSTLTDTELGPKEGRPATLKTRPVAGGTALGEPKQQEHSGETTLIAAMLLLILCPF